MAEKKMIPSFDFKKITKEEIFYFMKDNATQDEKDAFMDTAFVKAQQTVMEPEMVLSANGKMVQKQVRRKQKDGTYKMIPKMKAVPVEGGEVIEKYSHRKAVNWFYETYCQGPNAQAKMTNLPKKKAKDDRVSAKELFSEL